MTRTIIAALIVVLGLALMALSSCEGSTEDAPGPIEYPNEGTTSEPVIQYPNEYSVVQYSNEHVETTLPETGGIKVW